MEYSIPLQPVREQAVTVVCCGDTTFTAPTGVLFRSILDHADPQRFYDLIFFHNGVEPELLQLLCSVSDDCANASIRTCDIRPVFSADGLHTNNRTDLSVMTYARLLLGDLLSDAYHRVLYLDGDMVAFTDVAQLYDSDLQGKPLGSTVDFGFLAELDRGNRQYAAEVLGLQEPEDYCMAAVLLLDLDQIRADYPTKLLMDTARSRNWIWHDQDVINHLYRGRICHLNPAWDVIVPDGGIDGLPASWRTIYEMVMLAPNVVHFAGRRTKPWENLRSPFASSFWETALKTSFFPQLIDRLMEQPETYEQLYRPYLPQRGWKRLLRAILPPPAERVHRDLRCLLDQVDLQTANLLCLLRLLEGAPAVEPDFMLPPEPELPVQPVFANAVTVVCCGDEQFAAPTAVLFRSILDHRDPKRWYDLLYLHNGISAGTRQKLCAMAEGMDRVSIRTCDIRQMFSDKGLLTENRRDFSPMAYARLLLGDLLDRQYNRVVYLDGDMIAFADVAALFDCDLQGMPLGSSTDFHYAAQSYGCRTEEARVRTDYVRQILGIQRGEQYILSGMLVMELQKIRVAVSAKQLMETARARQWQWHDQDVINYVFCDQICLLDPAWDIYTVDPLVADLPEDLQASWQKAVAHPNIFHFAGSNAKPWQRYCPEYGKEFWQVARRTSFYGRLLQSRCRNLNTYAQFYPEKGVTGSMIKRFLKKILPPPVNSVQRDLKTVLHAIDEQKQLSFLLMQQLEELKKQQTLRSAPAVKIPKQRLQFEFSLAAQCNLNCAGCSHFAPLAQPEFPDFEDAERSFAQLSKLFNGQCEYIHLMGGEPLLNPRCVDYFAMARRYFPVGEIELMTNGLLLPGQPDSFYEACREHRITITVTVYPIALDYTAIQARCEKHGVRYRSFTGEQGRSQFNRLQLDLSGAGDMTRNFQACQHSNNCLFLYNGRLYPCGIGAHLRLFEAHFQQGLVSCEEDSVDIFTVDSGSDLLRQMAKAVPMCRYCRPDCWQTLVPWGKSGCAMTEWT